MIGYDNDFRGHVIHKEELDSTNSYLTKLCDAEKVDEYTTVLSDFQTRGRGQIGNSWESERGKNLTFSTVVYPTNVIARDQFIISIITSVAICDALSKYTDDISVKWPNDIYWKDKKICGMLIENDLQGIYVSRSVLGIGVNVNQQKFYSEAPNPVSLYQIIDRDVELDVLLNDIICRLKNGFDKIRLNDIDCRNRVYSQYKNLLFRRNGIYRFRDKNGEFMASIYDVQLDGHLILLDTDNRLSNYLFKEVMYLFP